MTADFDPNKRELEFVADGVHAVMHELAHRPSIEYAHNALLMLRDAVAAVERAERKIAGRSDE
ncbi:hypothetical protein [Noviluteimonas gilva]|uniref:Uncharacterized protein n=1 Tax=Noviluteimonas gilva TaxID=2682097 RepID=A0A7C9HU61_9GAMM|nr:hypothetical protein [Lysobacter gilvus]MUV15153.1 hypothetical protein [Lysobacter gilvus]